MSRGKYSPNCPNTDKDWSFFDRNCYGDIPPEYDHEAGEYDSLLHFVDYDPEGFDSYGYSAFDAEGNFVGHGMGVDRNGITEMEYLTMEEEEYLQYL